MVHFWRRGGGIRQDVQKSPKGKEIKGISEINDSLIFHAGTVQKDGKTLTNGGRVLAVTSFDNDYRQALKKSYQNIEKISFDRMNYRSDIGFDLS